MSTTLLQPTRRRQEPVDDVRRREFLAGVLAAGFLAACGDEKDDGVAADDGFPVTIKHSFGSTTIRSRPARVVSLDIYETDAVLALGVKPIAINYHEGMPLGVSPWYGDRLRTPLPARLRYVDGYPIERVAALRPDLILGSYPDKPAYRLLSRIAPTVVQDYAVPTDTRAIKIGRALGLEREARAAIADLDERLASARRTIGLDGKTVAVGFYEPGTGLFPGDVDSNTSTLRALGARPGPRLVNLPEEEAVSLEQVNRFEADVLFVSCESPKIAADLKAEPLFQSLDVVKRGATLVSTEPLDTDLLTAKGLLSVSYALEHFYPRLGRLAGA